MSVTLPSRKIITLGDDWLKRAMRTRPGNIVGIWMLDEQGGTVAYDAFRRNNGAIVGTTLGQPGVIPGHTSQLFDGANDYVSIFSGPLSTHPDNELCTNGELTTNTTGWAVGAVSTLTRRDYAAAPDIDPTGGINEFGLEVANGGTANAAGNMTITTVVGVTYNVSCRAYSPSANTQANAARLGFGTATANATAEDAWETLSLTFTATATSTTLACICQGNTAGDLAHFDKISCKAASGNGFSGSRGSLLTFAKVSGAGVWADGATRRASFIYAGTTGFVYIGRTTVNGQIALARGDISGTKSVTAATTTSDWMALALTWSVADDALKAYLNGVQQGVTQTGLGQWIGSPSSTLSCIGAKSTAPVEVWSGSLQAAGLWNEALSPSEIAALSRVS